MPTLIGQEKNIARINNWPWVPNFIMLEGAKGSGRKTLIRYIAEKFEADSILVGNKVDDIRSIIEDASGLFKKRIYILEGDDMSISAKNSLLKITEEPPRNCHIALLVSSTDNSLPTLVSRSNVISMEPYTLEQKADYLKTKVKLEDERTYLEYARMVSTLGEFEPLVEFGIQYVYEKVWAVYDSIWEVTDSNALNIANWLKLKKKGQEDLIEPIMFFKALMNVGSWITVKDSDVMSWGESRAHAQLLILTSNCLRKLLGKSVSKEITVNTWINEVKRIE